MFCAVLGGPLTQCSGPLRCRRHHSLQRLHQYYVRPLDVSTPSLGHSFQVSDAKGHPYSHRLPGCGHTFCQKCLSDWFDTTLRNFLANNPGYNVNNPGLHHLGYLIQHPQLANHPQLAHLMPPRPEYACPECRTPVKSRPVENFAMKSFVTLCHTATHGLPPPAAHRRGSPWEGFFPQ